MHALIKTCGILIVSRELSDARGRVVRETPAPCVVPRRDACASFVRRARDLAPSRESQTRADGDRAQRSAPRTTESSDGVAPCETLIPVWSLDPVRCERSTDHT